MDFHLLLVSIGCEFSCFICLLKVGVKIQEGFGKSAALPVEGAFNVDGLLDTIDKNFQRRQDVCGISRNEISRLKHLLTHLAQCQRGTP